MTIILLVAILWGASALCRAGRQAAQQARKQEEREKYLNALVDKEIERRSAAKMKAEEEMKEAQAAKEAEKSAKREYQRQQAEADLEHYAAMRSSYTDLIEAMTAEAQASTTTDKRRNTLQRQILALEEKVYKIDQRRAKAYYIAQEAC